MKIFLNAGHGGPDPGAVSKSGLKEKDVTKRICEILAEKLRHFGVEVIEFQEQNSYFEISKAENKSGADLFVSVHCNSFSNTAACGVETCYFPTSANGKRLAGCIQKELINYTGLVDRGCKMRRDLHVLKATKAPAVLVETAFISNPEEEKLLKSRPEIFADGIFAGIKDYIS